jgi:hypothetical protein
VPIDLNVGDDGWLQLVSIDGRPLGHSVVLQLLPDGDGRLRIRQLRIDGRHAPVPITRSDLLDLPLARVEAVMNAMASELAPGDILTVESEEPDSAFRLPQGGPTAGLTDEFLRSVARAYIAAVQRGERPNVAMAEQTGYPLKSVQRWVYTARQRGIMPRGSRGRPG